MALFNTAAVLLPLVVSVLAEELSINGKSLERRNLSDLNKTRNAKYLGDGTVVCKRECKDSDFDIFDFFFYDDESDTCVITCNITGKPSTTDTTQSSRGPPGPPGSPGPIEPVGLPAVPDTLEDQRQMVNLPPSSITLEDGTITLNLPRRTSLTVLGASANLMFPNETRQGPLTGGILPANVRLELVSPSTGMLTLPIGTTLSYIPTRVASDTTMVLTLQHETQLMIPSATEANGPILPTGTLVVLPSRMDPVVQDAPLKIVEAAIGTIFNLPEGFMLNLPMGTSLTLMQQVVANITSLVLNLPTGVVQHRQS